MSVVFEGLRKGTGSKEPLFGRKPEGFTMENDTLDGDDDDDDNEEEMEMLREMLNRLKTKHNLDDIAVLDELTENKVVEGEIEVEVPKEQKPERIIKLDHIGKEESTKWAFEVKTPITKPLNELIPDPAKTWPFELDSFQKQAILHLEEGKNVFVAAHTSAGKTVVAEYAIAMADRQQGRVIYTSPIKALSNQKYSDFCRIFDDVGLITGDLQVNDNARCLIMTTEILRSMLYIDNPRVQDLQFVIFDEVHYINDPERGHVWEEVLILLPQEVQIVMLSATVPNAMQFANWLGRAKQRPVAVSRTSLRPVPLHYYLYVGEGKHIMKIKEEDNFLLQNYRILKEQCDTVRDSTNYKRMKVFWNKLIAHLQKEQWTPTVVFALSRKKCDDLAEKCSGIDLTDAREKHQVEVFVKSQIRKLNEEDQNLLQIVNLKKYLINGIGVHHSGILPILKEIVEVLFSKGLVKILFATETFAVGVNMPARTVVFEDVNKFDGVSKRLLQPAEFIQMAGRAGRRGRDKTGTVIILTGYKLVAEHELRSMMMGIPSALSSQFRLTYAMILTTLRTKGDLTIENILRESYHEHGEQSKKSKYETQLEKAMKLEDDMKKLIHRMFDVRAIKIFEEFHSKCVEYMGKWDRLRADMLSSQKYAKSLVVGKIVIIQYGHFINCPALIVKMETNQVTGRKFSVFVFNPSSKALESLKQDFKMSSGKENKWYRLAALVPKLTTAEFIGRNVNHSQIEIRPEHIVAIANGKPLKMSDIEAALADQERMKRSFKRNEFSEKLEGLMSSLSRYLSQCTGGVCGNVVDEKAIKFDDKVLQEKARKLWELKENLETYPLDSVPDKFEILGLIFHWMDLKEQVSELKHKLSLESMSLYPDYVNKMQLLRLKEYINENDQVEFKGRMASCVGKFELLITESLVDNILNEVTCEEVAAIYSCLVCQAQAKDNDFDVDDDPEVPDSLKELVVNMKRVIAEVSSLERELDIQEAEGLEYSKISFMLVKPMYNWAKGMCFGDVMKMISNVQEGMMVRWIQQLLEVLKDVESASKLMGDPRVPAIVEAASRSIKRGIVFSPSIYTTFKDEPRHDRDQELDEEYEDFDDDRRAFH